MSHHLRVLREAHLVQFEAHGRNRIYRAAAKGLAPLRLWIATTERDSPDEG